MKQKILFVGALAAIAVLVAAGCSPSDDDSGGSFTTASQFTTSLAVAVSSTTASPKTQKAVGEVSVVVPFSAANGSGTVAVSGDGSPVAEWLANQPGEVSLDLVDADVTDPASVVEEMISFWYFQDENSGDLPPNIYVSASGDISDSFGTSYVVEGELLPPAPVVETTTTTTARLALLLLQRLLLQPQRLLLVCQLNHLSRLPLQLRLSQQ